MASDWLQSLIVAINIGYTLIPTTLLTLFILLFSDSILSLSAVFRFPPLFCSRDFLISDFRFCAKQSLIYPFFFVQSMVDFHLYFCPMRDEATLYNMKWFSLHKHHKASFHSMSDVTIFFEAIMAKLQNGSLKILVAIWDYNQVTPR